MKTKILLLAALAAAIVYSCTSDREDEVQQPTLNKVDLKPLKTSNNNETSRTGDSITVQTQQTIPPGGFEPIEPKDPNEGDPKDVPPRK